MRNLPRTSLKKFSRLNPEYDKNVREYKRGWEEANPKKCAEYAKKFRVKYRETINLRSRERNKAIRALILSEYGHACACCGTNEKEFLTIDHINGGGNKHRKEIGGTGKFYRWLIKNRFPKEDFRLLCMNCNFSYGQFGYCPHKDKNSGKENSKSSNQGK